MPNLKEERTAPMMTIPKTIGAMIIARYSRAVIIKNTPMYLKIALKFNFFSVLPWRVSSEVL